MSGFLLGDIVIRAMGLSYNGVDRKGNQRWDRIVAADISILVASDCK